MRANRKRGHKIDARTRMRWLKAARILKQGGLLAHPTSTISGVAASPNHPSSLRRLQRFKGRKGPFLLIADGLRTVARLPRFYPPALRHALRHWPDRTTILFPARPILPPCLYRGSFLAVRVDAHPGCCLLARACGGLFLSSSLNRHGKPVRQPQRRLLYRWHRYLDGWLPAADGQGKPSRLMKVSWAGVRFLR